MRLASLTAVRRSPAAVRPPMAGAALNCALAAGSPLRGSRAFTLIELILVMSILTVAVSFTAPAMSRFFGGRTMDAEARRLLAMTRQGQSRAVSEGVVIDMWFDETGGRVGLEAQATFERTDSRREEFELDPSLKLQISSKSMMSSSNVVSRTGNISRASLLKKAPVKPNLPSIHFQPDGSLGENSTKAVRLTDRNGVSVWLALAKTRSRYEIRNTED